jgi:methylmalonyl-CoA/ethylmalonyl-CoA epimerase
MKLAQVAVATKDLARATAFYRDTLGLPFLFEAPGLAFLDAGGVRLMLERPGRIDHTASILYYQVEDIDAAHKRLAARGVSFERAPHVIHRDANHELWMAFFRDSEENLLALMCPKALR